MSLRALAELLKHEVLGQRARYERYTADLLYMIAAGMKIDTNKVERFGALVDRVYMDPFKGPEKPMTAADVKQHLIDKIDRLLSGG